MCVDENDPSRRTEAGQGSAETPVQRRYCPLSLTGSRLRVSGRLKKARENLCLRPKLQGQEHFSVLSPIMADPEEVAENTSPVRQPKQSLCVFGRHMSC